MSAILDHRKVVLACEAVDLVEITGRAAVVHNYQRPGPLRDGLGDRLWIDRAGVGLHVREDRRQRLLEDRLVRRDERQRGSHDLGARWQIENAERELQRGRARVERNAVARANHCCERLLELVRPRSASDPSRSKRVCHANYRLIVYDGMEEPQMCSITCRRPYLRRPIGA